VSERKYTVKITRKIYDDGFGFAVVVGEDPDGSGLVSIHYSEDGTTPPDGMRAIVIEPQMALLVATELEKQARYLIARETIA
jgi:hypothetical protein